MTTPSPAAVWAACKLLDDYYVLPALTAPEDLRSEAVPEEIAAIIDHETGISEARDLIELLSEYAEKLALPYCGASTDSAARDEILDTLAQARTFLTKHES